ncbi:VP2 [Orbivirus alphaequi]|uniref:Outer capsid protein VP2 n=1 Tax=African horse sickness virus TaxID=40050 RepID=A0A0D4L456_AHSV|nr:VP2 [African horse sickness virus]
MASEFGILLTNQIYDQTYEKEKCDVIITAENAVRRVEVAGVYGYEWGATNHRLGLCEIENTKSIGRMIYEQIRCEGAYPIFPHYITDTLKYGKSIDRNDNQIRVDRDDERLRKIKIQPYFGEMYFSPENYITVFCKRQAISGQIEVSRSIIGRRMKYEESAEQTKGTINANKYRLLEKWRDLAYEQIEMEGSSERCLTHNTDPIYQLIKKMRFGMMYPVHYMLNDKYKVVQERADMGIEKWLLEKIGRGTQRRKADDGDNDTLLQLERMMSSEELERSVIESVIRFGSLYNAHAGKKTGDIPLEVLIKYCDSLTTFVHKKNREGGDNQTARDEIRRAMVKNIPPMKQENQMKVTPNIRNFLFFAYLNGFKRNNGVDIDPNNGTWSKHKAEVKKILDEEQKKNENKPLKVLIDGAYISTDAEYGTVAHWVDWVVDIIMTTQVSRMIKEYNFIRLKKDQLISGMNKLEDGVKCYAYCLILALYDFHGRELDGFAQGTRTAAIVETVARMFPDFRSEVSEKFGINLAVSEESDELFVKKTMVSSFSDSGEMGYKFIFGWRKTDFKVETDYGEIVSDEVHRLYQAILDGKEWSKEVDDPEKYFVDDLYNRCPESIYVRNGVDPNNKIMIKKRGLVGEGQRHFSARFVSYWYEFQKVTIEADSKRLDARGEHTQYHEIDVEDFKPCAIAELGLHCSTYIYQDLLVGANRGEYVKDAKELVWFDIANTNYNITRPFDRCWPSSCAEAELSLRFHLITKIFTRYRGERTSFVDIINELSERGYVKHNFPSYKHYYLSVIQTVFEDQRAIDPLDFCAMISRNETRESTLKGFSMFAAIVKSERLIDTLFLNFLLWIVFEMENVDVSAANKRHPLLISHEKGLRLIGVDLFNGALSISTGGWIPYLERICSEEKAQRRLNADELKIKSWFLTYYMNLSLERRAEPRMSFKFEGLTTWIGSNCGGVRDYVVQALPMRKPKPGLLMVIYGDDGDARWVEWAMKNFTAVDGSLGFIYIDRHKLVNKSDFRVREMKIYNRGRLDRLILISSGHYTFGNKFLMSKLLAKTE